MSDINNLQDFKNYNFFEALVRTREALPENEQKNGFEPSREHGQKADLFMVLSLPKRCAQKVVKK